MNNESQIKVQLTLHDVTNRKIDPAAHDKWEHLRTTLTLTIPEGRSTRDTLRTCLNDFCASHTELHGYHPYGEIDATIGEHRQNLRILSLLLSNGSLPELCLQASILPF